MTKEDWQIKCDKCDWTTLGYVPDWNNKICPKCNDCTIITDQDMEVFNTINGLIELGIATSDPKAKGIMVEVDTSKLR